MSSASTDRERMVELQLAGRGIADRQVLEAFRSVQREEFVPEELAEFAYEDSPLPIAGGQTISQPYIVAVTVDALELRGGERVLEIGTGSGYAAAVLSRIADQVYTVERLASLAETARARLAKLGYQNVHVRCGDGTLGWAEHAPYDAIAVAAGGPDVPKALLEQLAPGGRLVVPVGPQETQELVRVTREDERFVRESLGAVRFVPLIGADAWPEGEPAREPLARRSLAKRSASDDAAIAKLVRETAEPLSDIDSASIDALLERIGDARIVLLGEATHGTSEFYRMRARISRELIARRGFDFVAVEADWPDAMRIHRYVTGAPRGQVDFTPFARFPTWMWRNAETEEFVAWLRAHNLERRDPARRAGFFGLDLYSLFTSLAHVLAYLDRVDPAAARVARARYGTLTPWQRDPAAYGRAVLSGRYASAEREVVASLRELLVRRLDYAARDGEAFFDAERNAQVVADAEAYYRTMYYGSADSWNLRDTHMFETLGALLDHHGPGSRGIVWEHNSHIGNARATEMSARGELNVGELCCSKFGPSAYAIGFATDHGTVAAATEWDGPMERKHVRPARPDSYESLCHASGMPAFALHLREPRRAELRDELLPPRLERAIGVIYRPETERASHYFHASLPLQFDELIWFDETRAVEPLGFERRPSSDLSDTYPFGL
jgi:protein-L-isoaspartate(D-aspartate) O-methyltransferase